MAKITRVFRRRGNPNGELAFCVEGFDGCLVPEGSEGIEIGAEFDLAPPPPPPVKTTKRWTRKKKTTKRGGSDGPSR